MSIGCPRLPALLLIGAIAGLSLLALAPAMPVAPARGPLVGAPLQLAPEDARALVRRRTITPEFDSRAALRVSGRDVSLGGPLSCDAGEGWRIDVTVTQGASRETARSAGNCTGTVQEWRGRVAGDRLHTFRPGSARACARLVTTDAGGDVTDRDRWCRDVTLASEATAPVAAAANQDEDEDADTLSVVALVVAGVALLFGAVTLLLARRRT